ncbi:hypothetical protein [Deinococcus pimensis]|uniref:hypothetical protein n=1 Tax=Deinococcus pimensis TaxID=309888 RepID=UPI0004AF409E|nr:hypothetical protein [Deinococcus pimensis]
MPHRVVHLEISLPEASLRWAEEYRETHGLAHLDAVLVRAVEVLRDLDLIEGYRVAAGEHRRSPDPLLDSDISEGLEPSDGREWLDDRA